jgi:hypothetical protein
VLVNSNGGTNETYITEEVLKNKRVAKSLTLLDNLYYTQIIKGGDVHYVEVKQEVANETKRSSK